MSLISIADLTNFVSGFTAKEWETLSNTPSFKVPENYTELMEMEKLASKILAP